MGEILHELPSWRFRRGCSRPHGGSTFHRIELVVSQSTDWWSTNWELILISWYIDVWLLSYYRALTWLTSNWSWFVCCRSHIRVIIATWIFLRNLASPSRSLSRMGTVCNFFFLLSYDWEIIRSWVVSCLFQDFQRHIGFVLELCVSCWIGNRLILGVHFTIVWHKLCVVRMRFMMRIVWVLTTYVLLHTLTSMYLWLVVLIWSTMTINEPNLRAKLGSSLTQQS